MIRDKAIVQDSSPDTLPELRDLFNEYPFLQDRGPDTVRNALLTTRGLAVSELEVSVALDSLRVEGGVLA